MSSAHSLGDLPPWAQDLLERGRVARLGFADADGHPRVLPITYALAENALWSAIDDKPKRGEPARLRYLRQRPQVSVVVDRYDDDWSRLAWVQLLGDMEVLAVSEASVAPGLDALIAKYPPYRDEPPPGPVLRLSPQRALWWRAADSGRDSMGTIG